MYLPVDCLPYPVASTLWEMLSCRDLAALARTNRRLLLDIEPFLYRRHAITSKESAVMWAVQAAGPSTQTTAIRTLDKIKEFCSLAGGALDSSYITDEDCFSVIRDDLPFCTSHFCCCCCGPSSTPLHMAAWHGFNAIVAWLLANGANVNGPGCFTPLQLAFFKNRFKTIEILLLYGATIS